MDLLGLHLLEQGVDVAGFRNKVSRPQNSRYIGDLHSRFLQIFRMEQYVPHMYSTDDIVQIFSVDRISGILCLLQNKVGRFS